MGIYGSKYPTVREETEIDISYKKLSSLPLEFSQEIYQFTNLNTLNASNNEIPTLAGIKRLTFLLHLNLERNNIKEFEEELLQLVELQTLNCMQTLFCIRLNTNNFLLFSVSQSNHSYS